MGIQGLGKIIDYADCVEIKNFGDISQIFAVDGYQLIYKIIMNYDNVKHFNNINMEIFYILKSLIQIMKNNKKLIICLDGSPPDCKKETLSKRKNEKQNAMKMLENSKCNEKQKLKYVKKGFSLGSEHIEEYISLLDLLGIPYIMSPEEAEAQCAALTMLKFANATVSRDYDTILFGCKFMVTHINKNCVVKQINRDKLLKNLGINEDQLIDLCIILGTDYSKGIDRIDPLDAYFKFKMCNFDIEKFISKLMSENENRSDERKYLIPYNFMEKRLVAKNYFLNAPVVDPRKINITWSEPKYDKIREYLLNKKFDINFINDQIQQLRKIYNYYIKKF